MHNIQSCTSASKLVVLLPGFEVSLCSSQKWVGGSGEIFDGAQMPKDTWRYLEKTSDLFSPEISHTNIKDETFKDPSGDVHVRNHIVLSSVFHREAWT